MYWTKTDGDIVVEMGFGEIKKVKGKTILTIQMDLINGLGYDQISGDKLPTFIESSSLPEKSFSFDMKNHPEESYMAISGIDEELGLTEMESHDVI